MTKVKKTEQCIGTVGMMVGRYLALPYGFSLSEWVVQVVLPNEVHVLRLLVGVARHSSQ